MKPSTIDIPVNVHVSLDELVDVKRLHLEPGDHIVVRTEAQLTREQGERIRADVERVFVGHKVLILVDGLELEIVKGGACDHRLMTTAQDYYGDVGVVCSRCGSTGPFTAQERPA